MCIKINFAEKFLKSNFIPARLRGYLLKYLRDKYNKKEFVVKTSFNGSQFYTGGIFGETDGSLLYDFIKSEEKTIDFLSDLFIKKNIKSIIDVGSNTGQSLLLFKLLNNNCKVHCFEPFPQLINLLNTVVLINNFNNVYINNVLVSNSNGIGELYFEEKSTETASTVENFQDNFNSKIEVKQCTIDQYMHNNEMEELHLLKVDVEGGELEVFEGAIDTLRNFKPDIVLELLYTQYGLHLKRQYKLITLLKELKYEFYLIKDSNVLEYQDNVQPDKEYRYLNYYLTAHN